MINKEPKTKIILDENVKIKKKKIPENKNIPQAFDYKQALCIKNGKEKMILICKNEKQLNEWIDLLQKECKNLSHSSLSSSEKNKSETVSFSEINDPKKIEKKIEEGINPNILVSNDNYERTIFHFLMQQSTLNLSLIQKCLKNNANPNIRTTPSIKLENKEIGNSFFSGIDNKNISFLGKIYLKKEKKKSNTLTSFYKNPQFFCSTPTHFLCSNTSINLEILKLFMWHKADLTIKDYNGLTSYDYLFKNPSCKKQILLYLQEKENQKEFSKIHLDYYIQREDADYRVFRFFYDSGSSVSGFPHYIPNLEILEFLLKKRELNLGLLDPSENSILYNCLSMKKISYPHVSLLLKYGANPKLLSKNNKEKTALELFFQNTHNPTEILVSLFKYGVDTDIVILVFHLFEKIVFTFLFCKE